MDSADLLGYLGYRLREARNRAGLTQEEAAAKSGVSQSQISRIEDSQRGVRGAEYLMRLLQLAPAYGTSVVAIFEEVLTSHGLSATERRQLRRAFFGEE